MPCRQGPQRNKVKTLRWKVHMETASIGLEHPALKATKPLLLAFQDFFVQGLSFAGSALLNKLLDFVV